MLEWPEGWLGRIRAYSSKYETASECFVSVNKHSCPDMIDSDIFCTPTVPSKQPCTCGWESDRSDKSSLTSSTCWSYSKLFSKTARALRIVSLTMHRLSVHKWYVKFLQFLARAKVLLQLLCRNIMVVCRHLCPWKAARALDHFLRLQDLSFRKRDRSFLRQSLSVYTGFLPLSSRSTAGVLSMFHHPCSLAKQLCRQALTCATWKSRLVRGKSIADCCLGIRECLHWHGLHSSCEALKSVSVWKQGWFSENGLELLDWCVCHHIPTLRIASGMAVLGSGLNVLMWKHRSSPIRPEGILERGLRETVVMFGQNASSDHSIICP